MTGEEFFNGFGVRTVCEGAAKYDPQSYHNGSVWPHDTALIARGLGQTGHTAEAAKLVEGLLRIAEAEDYRMPELVAGFAQKEGQGPVSFPHACRPQAWAAATSFQGLQALLGLDIDAAHNTVKINPSSWPAEWGKVIVRDLEVGSKKLSFSVDQSGLKVLENNGGVRIVSPPIAPKNPQPSPSP
jgi:glycogen debranching enzyme